MTTRKATTKAAPKKKAAPPEQVEENAVAGTQILRVSKDIHDQLRIVSAFQRKNLREMADEILEAGLTEWQRKIGIAINPRR